MERTFAGFWVDGAVRKPEERHVDSHGMMTFKRKRDGEVMTRLTDVQELVEISKFYWIDTTTPTELTPQQAFELFKVTWPSCTAIEKVDRFVSLCGPIDSIINWGNLTEYPPKKPEVWRVPTDADKGENCRYWCGDKRQWVDATFVSTWGDAFIVKGEYWPYPIEVPKCEILDDPL